MAQLSGNWRDWPAPAKLALLERLRQQAALRDLEQAKLASQLQAPPIWAPVADSPQMAAYHCQADELFYGGSAGGGKTDLLLGLAATAHNRAIIFRRTFPNLAAIIDRSRGIFTRDGDALNENAHRWRTADGRQVEFGAMQYEADRQNYRGRPYDLHAFDEITEFTESQFRFVTAWNRSTVAGQRCRIVCTGNPPSDNSGRWVVKYWGAWLDPTHPRPAVPGELRWYARISDKDTELDSGAPIVHNGETITPRSRTFIPARLTDNPYLRETNYAAVLASLPEPLRSQMLYGDFGAAEVEDIWQVIPTAWIQAAMRRPGPELDKDGRPPPVRAIGVDVARGGADQTVAAVLRGAVFFDPLHRWPGKETPTGNAVATRVVPLWQAGAAINVDAIGVGAAAVDALRQVEALAGQVYPVNVGAGTDQTDKSGTYRFRNIRAATWWLFREALDPEHGAGLVLPEDHQLLADLAAPRWEIVGGRIQVEAKEDIAKRIGRSTDSADAVILAWQRVITGQVQYGPDIWG